MDLGEFSVSLAVKDIDVSRVFYEKLGFDVVDGQHSHEDELSMEEGQDWLILRQGETTLGLFQGMFENNILTFNPHDVREVQASLKERGVALKCEVDEETSGPACAVLVDPDGNTILLDQHDE